MFTLVEDLIVFPGTMPFTSMSNDLEGTGRISSETVGDLVQPPKFFGQFNERSGGSQWLSICRRKISPESVWAHFSSFFHSFLAMF